VFELGPDLKFVANELLLAPSEYLSFVQDFYRQKVRVDRALWARTSSCRVRQRATTLLPFWLC